MFQNSNVIERDGTAVEAPFAALRYKKKVPLHEGGTYPLNWKNEIRTEVPTISQNNRDQYEIEEANEYAKKVNGPVSPGDVPYLLLEDPGRIFYGIDKDAAAEVNMVTYNPYISQEEKLKRKLKLAAIKAPAVILNTALGVGFTPAAAFSKPGIHTLSAVGNELFNPLAGMNIGKSINSVVANAVDSYLDRRIVHIVTRDKKRQQKFDGILRLNESPITIESIFKKSFDRVSRTAEVNLPASVRGLFFTPLAKGYLERKLYKAAIERRVSTDAVLAQVLKEAPDASTPKRLISAFLDDGVDLPNALKIAEFVEKHHGFSMYLNKHGMFVKDIKILDALLDDDKLFKEFYETYKRSTRGVIVELGSKTQEQDAIERLAVGLTGWIGRAHHSSNSFVIKQQFATGFADMQRGFTGELEMILPGVRYNKPARQNHKIISDNVVYADRQHNVAIKKRFNRDKDIIVERAYGDDTSAERITVNSDKNGNYLSVPEMLKKFNLTGVAAPAHATDPHIMKKLGAWGLKDSKGASEYFHFDDGFYKKIVHSPEVYLSKLDFEGTSRPYKFDIPSELFPKMELDDYDELINYMDEAKAYNRKKTNALLDRDIGIPYRRTEIERTISENRKNLLSTSGISAAILAGSLAASVGIGYGVSSLQSPGDYEIEMVIHNAYGEYYPYLYKLSREKNKELYRKYYPNATDGTKISREMRKKINDEHSAWEYEWMKMHPLPAKERRILGEKLKKMREDQNVTLKTHFTKDK